MGLKGEIKQHAFYLKSGVIWEKFLVSSSTGNGSLSRVIVFESKKEPEKPLVYNYLVSSARKPKSIKVMRSD
jgi:hypothetical protein